MLIFLRSIRHKLRWDNYCFLNPILSGNKPVSSVTCHHLRFNTADGLSLGIGDGGVGLDTQRIIDAANPPEKRIPRNTSALFNLVQWI
jgi:cytochrome c peroxidase